MTYKKIYFKDYESSLIMYALDFTEKEIKRKLEGKCSKKDKKQKEFVLGKINDVMTKIRMGDVEFSSVEICLIEQAVSCVSKITNKKAMLEKRKEDPEKWEDFDYRVDSVLGKINFTNSLYEALEDIQKEHPELEVSVGF